MSIARTEDDFIVDVPSSCPQCDKPFVSYAAVVLCDDCREGFTAPTEAEYIQGWRQAITTI